MTDRDKHNDGKEASPSLLLEARRLIEEYAADLWEIIRQR